MPFAFARSIPNGTYPLYLHFGIAPEPDSLSCRPCAFLAPPRKRSHTVRYAGETLTVSLFKVLYDRQIFRVYVRPSETSPSSYDYFILYKGKPHLIRISLESRRHD